MVGYAQEETSWTLKWDRKTKEFSVRFSPGYWDSPKRTRRVIYAGIPMTQQESDRLYLSERLTKIVLTGGLED